MIFSSFSSFLTIQLILYFLMIILHGHVVFDSSSDLSVLGSGVSSWSSEQTSGINFSTCLDGLFCVFKIKHFDPKTLPGRTLTCSWYCCYFYLLISFQKLAWISFCRIISQLVKLKSEKTCIIPQNTNHPNLYRQNYLLVFIFFIFLFFDCWGGWI